MEVISETIIDKTYECDNRQSQYIIFFHNTRFFNVIERYLT